MRFTVECVCFGLYRVVDNERLEPGTGAPRTVSLWRTYAGALSNAMFRNQHPVA